MGGGLLSPSDWRCSVPRFTDYAAPGQSASHAPMWYWFATEQGRAVDINSLKRSQKQQQALAALRQGKSGAIRSMSWKSAKLRSGHYEKRAERTGKREPALYDWRERFSVSGDRLRLNRATPPWGDPQCLRPFLSRGYWPGSPVPARQKSISVCWKTCSRGKQALVMVPELA